MSRTAYLLLVVATLLWAGNMISGKLAIGHISPMMLNLLRWVLAFVLIVAVSLPQLRRDWPLMRRNWALLLGYGMFGYTLFNALLYTAMTMTSGVNGAIEQAIIPMLIFIINYILFRIRATAAQLAGFVLTIAGIAITASHGNPAALLELEVNGGDLMVLAAAAIYAVYTIALRWKPAIGWQSLMAASALGAIVGAVPMLAWEMSRGAAVFPDARGWLLVLYTGLLPSLVSQIFWVKGVEVIGANRAGLFINLIPVFGTILSVVFLGETLSGFHIVALVLVTAGIAIAEKGKPKA
ncbi:DMT family transporter [Rhizobiaceae bacterium BDR2-2]|uniref:DMT family transporter n=1 Tax=Ectorhizobium quercum TaxID=2965071 RepID=A0AAE3MYC5_9HYPH|nr:DMT family transporter [Ectorhizobium quercum]MCX8996731.1 DMT family transporter [Ectorhizobium quercum]